MQLIVLGMHRSCTSVLARMLNLMGAYFGPEGSSTGANDENPKGFWERRDVRVLNDAVLHSTGHDWNRIDGFDVDQLPTSVIADFQTRASRLVLGMDAHRPWMLKEPRLCLLLPLWRRVLEVPLCVHIFRHPVEVASSLQKRNGMPMATGLVLWESYVRRALAASSDLPGVVVGHDRLLAEPFAVLERLFHALESYGVTGIRMPARREVEAFVEPRLHRERRDRTDLLDYADAPQVGLFERLMAQGLPRHMDAAVDEEQREHLLAYEASLPPLAATGRLAMPTPKDRTLQQQMARQERETAAAIAALRESSEERIEKLQELLEQLREEAGDRRKPVPRMSRLLQRIIGRR